MSMIKYLPWVGWLLLAAMTSLYLGKRDDLAAQIESCNTDKVQAVADAEKAVREALVAAQERERVEAVERVRRAQAAAVRASEARLEAQQQADRAQATIRRLMREVGENETVEIEQACLAVDVPADIINDLRVR